MPFFSPGHGYFPFGIGFVLIALFLPLALVLKVPGLKGEVRETVSNAALLRIMLSASLVLVGGFVLKLALVYLGQISRLS